MKIGLYELSWNFQEYSASTLASTFNMSSSFWIDPSDKYNQYYSKMATVQQLNPAFKSLMYRNVMSIYSTAPAEWNYANSQGWLLKDANGNYVTEASWAQNFMVDITNASYQQWLGNRIVAMMSDNPNFAGVFLDQALQYSAAVWSSAGNATSINPSTGQPFTTQQILDGCVGVINAVTNVVGSTKLVVANGIWSGNTFSNSVNGANYRYILSHTPNLTGIMSEGPFFRWEYGSTINYYDDYNPSYWQNSVDMTVWLQNNFLSLGSNRVFVADVPVEASPMPAGTTKEGLAMFGYCSFMLGVSVSGQNYIDFGVTEYNLASDTQMLALAQQLQSLQIGTPTGSYYTSGSLYLRNFTHGMVIVDPVYAQATYTLGRSYTLMNGTVVSGTITIQGHNGLILLS